MTQILRQSTAVDVLIGPFVDSGDGYTAETGLTIAQADVRLSKNGQNMAQKNDSTTCVHDEIGYYNCELDATDTDTVGTLILAVDGDATSLPVRHEFQVLDEVAYDALYGSSATILTSADVGRLFRSVISTVNSPTSFDMTDGIAQNDLWIGLTAGVYDTSSGEVWITYVSDVVAASNRLILNAAPPFTATTSDEVIVFNIPHPAYALSDYGAATATDLDSGVNITKVNGVTVTGAGTSDDPWGP
jgi:hypothetical protein